VRSNEVGPRFFRALGIPILAGRSFTAADGISSPKVAIVTEAFARRFHLGHDVVGRHLAFGGDPRGGTAKFEIEIVGLAADAKYKDLKEPAPALLYTPYLQDSTLGALVYYARTARPPEELQRLVPALVAGVDPAIAVVGLKTVERQVRESVFLDRMIGLLSGAFAGLALLLASVGLYGVLSYSVAQRTREFGVRMALGADARGVRGLVLRQVVRLTLLGGAAGAVAAFGLGRVMQTLLFGLTSHDPRVIAASTGVLIIVALAAGYVPAWHASRIDPMRALRAD
jgi:predicted permease